MSARALPVLTALLVTAATVTFTGCSSKPENSPVIRKKFAEVDGLKDEIAETNRLIRSLTGEVTIMKDEMSNLRALAPDGAGGSELAARLGALEKRLAEMESNGTTVASVQAAANRSAAPKEVAATFNGLAVPERPAATATTGSVAASKPVASQPRATTSATTRAAAPAPKPAVSQPSAPRGRYHTIQDGDTLEKIAASNNVSVAELRQANRLPEGARPLKGQRLFVPAK
ncbi:MAG: LysM peptidoglycan-binding domain-containing protein [Candidatus Sumerlaeia bacterium]|nr:LysM peptidoglycan-binding domain-containing protein [Candidatus Sumerlaeia bacterium]